MKSFKHYFNLSFKTCAVVMLLLSVGSASSVASAHHIRGYHSSVTRRVHQIHRKISKRKAQRPRKNQRKRKPFRRGSIKLRVRRRGRKRVRTLTRWQRRQINRNCYELNQRTIWDINKDRQYYNLPRLRVDRHLSKIGLIRSHQLQSYFSHNTKSHIDEVQFLLSKDRIYGSYGENIANSALGTIKVIAVGSYNNPRDAKKSAIAYKAHNGYQLADNINNASMYHDADDNNGHRENILSKQYKRIGVGDSFSTHDNSYYLAIEFVG